MIYLHTQTINNEQQKKKNKIKQEMRIIHKIYKQLYIAYTYILYIQIHTYIHNIPSVAGYTNRSIITRQSVVSQAMKREINNTRSEMKMKLKVNILLKDIQKSEVGIFYT